jgi:hypothetical protein
VTAAPTLTAPAAAPARTEAGPEGEAGATEAGTAETRAAETGTVREAGQALWRTDRAAVLGEVADAARAETAWAEAATAVLAVVVSATAVLIVIVPVAASFADAFAERPAHVAERVVPGLGAWIEWIVTHG